GNETWGVTIGDVCGRGPHAAALTALARHTIRTAAIGGRPPVDVLHLLNDAILTENRERGDHERFLTALYLTVRPGDDGPAEEIVDRLERVVLAHTTSTTRADDLAIICLKPA